MADEIVQEEWRPCPDFPSYSVSNLGRVRRDVTRTNGKAGRLLVCRRRSGYMEVGLFVDGKQKFRRVHRLVALAFIGEPAPGKPHVNHLNCIRHDNRIENIEWASPKDNADHRERMGNTARGERNGKATKPERTVRGERHGNAKLTESDVREIRRRSATGESQRTIGAAFGINRTGVSKIACGTAWTHVK